MALKSGTNQAIEIFSIDTNQKVLEIQKKGDFGLSCFDFLGKFIIYSDCMDTQLFEFDSESLEIKKLTQKVLNETKIEVIPSC